MIISEGLDFIKDYVTSINEIIKSKSPDQKLSRLQCNWLGFIILGLLVTNSLCWSKFARFSIGKYSASSICWMFRRASIAWELLLTASVIKIIDKYNINSGFLVIDDTDIERSKNTKEIAKVHKIRDKRRNGFFNGKNIVFLLLVSDSLTIPVGFKFYQPDPNITKWRREDKRLRQQGVSKKYRPEQPVRDGNYPTKLSLALDLLRDFKTRFDTIKIKAVIADAFYGNKEFFDAVVSTTGQEQVLSQIKKTQLINVGGKFIQVQKFFKNYRGKTEELTLRFNNKKITYCSANFKVKTHNKKLRVVALKYDNEDDYRYLVANDSTWLAIDVVKAYGLRWLVEVFIQDWKSYEGWDKLAMQRGVEGSENGLLISLLCDHALHFHQDQIDLFKDKKSAATVGSLRERVIMESLMVFIENIVSSDNPRDMFDQYSDKISKVFELRGSSKHMRSTYSEDLVNMN